MYITQAAFQQYLKVLVTITGCRIGQCIDAEMSPKHLQERHKHFWLKCNSDSGHFLPSNTNRKKKIVTTIFGTWKLTNFLYRLVALSL